MRKVTPDEASSLRTYTAELTVEQYSINSLRKLFRQILGQPNVQSITFSSGQPVSVTYQAYPLEDTLEDRMSRKDITVAELMERKAIKAVPTTELAKGVLATFLAIEGKNLEASHVLVVSHDELKALGYVTGSTFLGAEIVITSELSKNLIVFGASASSDCGLSDIQLLMGVSYATA